ncbi:16S rRNA (guanine(966)-N(2))-methyltransferase RsmD [Aureimonas fodinaquatilis]|uniref:16S rRNA (Guanine(966)-N(2))-methyltransferase RsmD n=1 Tax=Aureimonas fodinaquatilis TaxID=2565783 RepID=A0A5B0DZG4_9HYPH|nr:16S rRNA (guanine(966)-N(2))-methyltransferase RsmD [Aureimonas fodinaquatilis]KAA0972207.1 16S rRNA (guanine(966)-N(2))-methyltransferase RsmD [Aureimonas fodinaquatilis]
MLRIVAGEFRGRALAAPKSDDIRPTSERHRGSLFNILEHGLGFRFEGTRVLDLFSGTGALGFEALSRGARFCVFIEDGVEGRGLIRTNVEAFGLAGRTKIFRRDATRLGEAGTVEPFDLLLADPPYGRRMGEAALASAIAGGWLRQGAVVMLEEGKEAPFSPVDGLEQVDERDMGASILRFFRRG